MLERGALRCSGYDTTLAKAIRSLLARTFMNCLTVFSKLYSALQRGQEKERIIAQASIVAVISFMLILTKGVNVSCLEICFTLLNGKWRADPLSSIINF